MHASVKLGPALGLLMAVGSAGSAHAQTTPIVISNPSFESPTAPTPPGYTVNDIAGWTGTSSATYSYGVGSYANDPSVWPNGIPDGAQYGDINAGAIYQNVNAFLTLGMTYDLSAYIGQHLDQTGSGVLSLYTVGGDLLASSPVITPVPGTFQLVSVQYTATDDSAFLGDQLQIQISKAGPVFTGTQTDFDEVTLTQAASPAVPEPGALPLLGLGLGGLILGGAQAAKRMRSAR